MVVHDPGFFVVYLRMCVGSRTHPVPIPSGFQLRRSA